MAAGAERSRSGVVVIDKPSGWTSHQVVGRVRRLAGTRKVGHAGTLDPMATGVLVVGIDRATRLLGRLAGTDKDYAATIRLGIATLTDDAEGEVTAAPGTAGLDPAAVAAALPRFRGEIWQVPSAVSAVKVGGVRSYARVRAGAEVDLPARKILVSRFACQALRPAESDGVPVVDLDVEVQCSSGTYVRALARDLGTVLGCGGHLTALRRTRVGPFGLDRAQTLEAAAAGLRIVDMAEVARQCFAVLEVDEAVAGAVRHGRRLPGVSLPADPTALVGAGEFLALYRPVGDDAVPEAVFVV